MSPAAKQIILAAHFPGREQHDRVERPRSKSQIEFDSFVHLAQTAERGKFDFFFLAEGLRLREQRGRIHDLDIVGRPDSADRAGRARRGHHAPRPGRHAQRHLPRALRAGPPAGHARPPVRRPGRRGTSSPRPTRSPARTSAAAASSTTPTATSAPASSSRSARELWDSWADDEIVADPDAGQFVRHGRRVRSPTTGRSSTSRALQRAAQPAGPPGHPPGRRQRRRARARRRDRRRDLQPAHARCARAQAVLRRRQGPPGPVRARARTS